MQLHISGTVLDPRLPTQHPPHEQTIRQATGRGETPDEKVLEFGVHLGAVHPTRNDVAQRLGEDLCNN